MTKINSLLLLTLGELLLVTSIVAILLLVRAILKKRRDRGAANRLIARIKEDAIRREKETRTLMEERFGLSGKYLDTLSKKIMREEKLFYQNLINLYLKRDSEALEILHVAFEEATEPYRTMELPKSAAADVGETADEPAELQHLKEENERLSEELRVTMDTIARMLNEYASMYSGGAEEDLDKAKLMEQFQVEGETPIPADGAVAGGVDEGEPAEAAALPDTVPDHSVPAAAELEETVVMPAGEDLMAAGEDLMALDDDLLELAGEGEIVAESPPPLDDVKKS